LASVDPKSVFASIVSFVIVVVTNLGQVAVQALYNLLVAACRSVWVAPAAAAAEDSVRTTEYRSLVTHLEWLVRYHVLEEEWPDITATATRELADGRRVPVTQQAVEDAVKKAADLLGLTLRKGRGPGRPAGSTTDPNKPSAGRVTKGTRRR